MNYSFQLYSARNATPWQQVYKKIAALGYSQVEGFGGVYENASETRGLLDSCELTMPSAHFAIDDLENDIQSVFSTASTLGCTHLFCPYIIEDQRPTDASGWHVLGKRLSEIGKQVNDKGFSFGWHNHDFEFTTCRDGSVPMRILLETATDIGWEMDVAWIARAGSDPSPWIKEFGPRVNAIHVKDIAAEGQNIDEDGWADVGHGILEWKSLFNQISAQTSATLFIAEHDNPNDLERFASSSIQSLKSFT